MVRINIDAERFEQIKENMLRNRESFDQEIYKIIKDYGHEGAPVNIILPNVSRKDRAQIHKYQGMRGYNYIYSCSGRNKWDEYRDMCIEVQLMYLTELKNKDKKIDDVIANFKKTTIDEIKTVIDKNINMLIEQLNL